LKSYAAISGDEEENERGSKYVTLDLWRSQNRRKFFKVGEIRPDWPVAGLKLTARAFDSVFTGPIGAKKIQYEYI